MLATGGWVCDVRGWVVMLETGCWVVMLGTGCWVCDVRGWVCDVRDWVLGW